MSHIFDEICSLISSFEKARAANDNGVILQLNAIEDTLFEKLSSEEQYQYGLVAMAHFLKCRPEDIDGQILKRCKREDLASKTAHLFDWNQNLSFKTMLSTMHGARLN